MAKADERDIRGAVREYFAKAGLQRRVDAASVVNDWAALVGPQLAEVTTPVSVDARGTLWVRVASAAWQQELHLTSREIIRELNRKGRVVRNIRWVAGDTTGGPPAYGSRPTGRP